MIAQPIHIAHTAAIISTRLCTNSTFASLACDWRQSPSVPAQTLQNPYPRELVVNDGPWVPEAENLPLPLTRRLSGKTETREFQPSPPYYFQIWAVYCETAVKTPAGFVFVKRSLASHLPRNSLYPISRPPVALQTGRCGRHGRGSESRVADWEPGVV